MADSGAVVRGRGGGGLWLTLKAPQGRGRSRAQPMLSLEVLGYGIWDRLGHKYYLLFAYIRMLTRMPLRCHTGWDATLHQNHLGFVDFSNGMSR